MKKEFGEDEEVFTFSPCTLMTFIFKKTNSYTIILKLHKHTKMANQAEFVKIVHLNHSVALVAL